MKISELKKHALRSLDSNWGKAICVVLLILLFNGVSSLIEIIASGGFSEWQAIQDSEDTFLPLWVPLVEIIIAFALIPLTVACSWFFLNLSRGDKPRPVEVFEPYKNGKLVWKLIGASIVQGIFIFLWSLLFIIPGIIKGFSYSQMFYILKDNPEMGILDAITESRQRMNGLKWKYFVMHLSFIGWAILALFTFGIGYLFLAPYIYATQAAFYQHLVADQKEQNEFSDLQ